MKRCTSGAVRPDGASVISRDQRLTNGTKRAFLGFMRTLALCMLALISIGCGSSAPAAKAPVAVDDPPAKVAKDSDAEKPAAKDEAPSSDSDEAIPTKCAKSDPCVPPPAYVKKLCSASYPSVALSFFRGGTPWTRGYLKQRTEAINASGGVSGEGFLEFDEEVIILQKRKNDYGGMQVSGAGGAMGGYYVLRWDGTCNDIDGAELTMNKPPQPKASKIEWRFLDENTQEALRQDAQLNDMINARRNECKGAASGTVSKKCVELDKKLTDMLAKVVRRGIDLPVPSRHP